MGEVCLAVGQKGNAFSQKQHFLLWPAGGAAPVGSDDPVAWQTFRCMAHGGSSQPGMPWIPQHIGQLAISGHRPHGISATSSHTRSKKSSRATIFPTPLLSLVYRTGGKCQVLRLKNRQGRGKYAILICGIFEREREEALCSIKFWCWTSTVP